MKRLIALLFILGMLSVPASALAKPLVIDGETGIIVTVFHKCLRRGIILFVQSVRLP